MSPRNKKLIAWELTRSRFHISDRFPPRTLRKEKEIGAILSEIINQEPQAEAELPIELTERWALVVGTQISKHTEPVFIEKRTLHVHADHPGWLTEVRRLPKNLLLKKLSTIPSLPEIQDIRFLLDPSIRTWKNRT